MAGTAVTPFQPRHPLIQTMSNAEIDAAEARQREDARQGQSLDQEQTYTGLSGYVRQQWDMMVRHRNTVAGWSDRLLAALRAFNGQYDPQKLAEIRKFGGSEVYARLIAAKCRGASSLLRDVYLGSDRSWGLSPPSDPAIPLEAIQAIEQLVQTEVLSAQHGAPGVPDPTGATPGAPPVPPAEITPEQIRARVFQLMEAARDAALDQARKETKIAEDKIDQILTEGNWYQAFAEFLTSLSMYPFAVIKGPTVRMVMDVKWNGHTPVRQRKPRLWWEHVSPFDLWWTPGVSNIEDAQLIHRIRVTRTDLNDLMNLPGYNRENIRLVLQNYGSAGLTENWDSTDATRAVLESRENPVYNMSNLITTLEFHGNVQGRMLLQYGFTTEQIPDELADYAIQAWLIGQYLIKVQLSPSPRMRHPFFLTSFEKVPSTPVGNGITDIISDLQEVANACLRAIVNNLSIASGPQVVVNDDRLAGQENGDELYPWKRWHTANPSVAGSTEPAISFFQPTDNSANLLSVFNAFYGLSDDISAIPRYLSGNSPGGGAGRTASGLAMLMGNASKILQTVCANIDGDVMTPMLRMILDIVLMTDRSGMLTGDEDVVPKGVQVALQRETLRQRQLEFLQITANPIDMQIIGPQGRANVLRAVSDGIGLAGEQIVPSAEAVAGQQKQAMSLAAQQGQPGHAMTQPPPGKNGSPQQPGQGSQSPKSQQGGPQVNAVGPRISGGV